MIRSSRSGTVSRRILIAVAAALAPVLAGCEAGLTAPSLQWHQPAEGTAAKAADGSITISNAFVLGPPIGAVLRPGQNAGFFLWLVNTGTSSDRLLSITAPGVAQLVRLPKGGVSLKPNTPAALNGPAPTVVLVHLIRPLSGGSVVTLQLLFAKAGLKTLQVPVMPRARFYQTYSPAPAPRATPSPAGTGRSQTPSASASPSPSSTH